MNKIKIGNKLIGEDNPVFIIAEGGINHNGDINNAKQLVKGAAKAGADAIKFQTHFPDKEMLDMNVTAGYVGDSLYNVLNRTKLSRDEHVELKKLAEDLGLIFLSTPFSREAADFLNELGVCAYKIGSGELTNIPLVTHIAAHMKPMIISTGMSKLKEIEKTLIEVQKINSRIILMQCTSTYPTAYRDVNLKVIPMLSRRFKLPVGLSDHSLGIYASLGAVALGAVVIEKHFTIDRNWPGPDQGASIEPHELMELVQGVRAVQAALGGKKKIIDEEVDIIKMARESIVSLEDIQKGSVIRKNMVWVKRPGIGIPAAQLYKVVGKIAKKDIKKNSLISWEDIR